MATADEQTPEPIPPEDTLSRLFMSVPADLDEASHFAFSSASNYVESLIWRKYAPAITDVHARGCVLQAKKLARNANSPHRYVGARSAVKRAIEEIKSPRGLKFRITHYIENGDRAHAELQIVPPANHVGKIKSTDVRDLVDLLMIELSAPEPHTCPEPV